MSDLRARHREAVARDDFDAAEGLDAVIAKVEALEGHKRAAAAAKRYQEAKNLAASLAAWAALDPAAAARQRSCCAACSGPSGPAARRAALSFQ